MIHAGHPILEVIKNVKSIVHARSRKFAKFAKLNLILHFHQNFANKIVSVHWVKYNVKEDKHGLTLNVINNVVANQFKATAFNVELDQDMHNNLIQYAKLDAHVHLVKNV